MQIAMFAAGCFWGVEVAFRRLEGVIATTVGYSGGTSKDPRYRDVCTGKTGHAEVVQVQFDPCQASYDQLLDVFWKVHDPTTLNRQGPDVGTQYRSVVFYLTPEQESAARESLQKRRESGLHTNAIVTQIVPASEFFRAEEYHQQYFAKQGVAES